MDLTTVHLVRHGEVHNPEGILYGRAPGYRLSALGAAMAEAAADHLAGRSGGRRARDVARLVASPLERALQTAAPLAAAFALAIGTDDRLIEADNAFAGHVVDAPFLLRPSSLAKLANPLKPSWGEPYREIAQRMRAAIADARDAARGREAVLVSHQLPIWIARLDAEGRRFAHDPRRRQCALGSITSLHFEDCAVAHVSYTEPALR